MALRANALALVLLSLIALSLSMDSAIGHNWVPRYNGVSWGQQCLAPASPRRVPPEACCQHARSYCEAVCDLTDIDNGWKAACHANCQSAGAACLQRVSWKRPPVGGIPGERPPATTN